MKKEYQRPHPDTLAKYLGDSGLSFKTGSNSYVFNCPKCGKKDKLYIRKRDGESICFSCPENSGFLAGAPEYALHALTNESVGSIKTKLYNLFNSETPELLFNLADGFKLKEELVEDELVTMEIPYTYYPIADHRSRKGQEYLISRGIPIEIATKYQIRYAPAESRVIFPVVVNGETVGWQKRWVKDTTWTTDDGTVVTVPKILSSSGIPRDRVLMFHDNLLNSPHAIVCEGPVDAIKCDLLGGNVAAMGKAVTEHQLKQITNLGIRKFYLALDPDAAVETMGLIKKLHDCEVFWLVPAAGYKDLGEMTFEQVAEQFKIAEPVTAGSLFFTFT
jgi:predicted RNA-binding Zn-ribbon protein involved in translation (DUF1610 family)